MLNTWFTFYFICNFKTNQRRELTADHRCVGISKFKRRVKLVKQVQKFKS